MSTTDRLKSFFIRIDCQIGPCFTNPPTPYHAPRYKTGPPRLATHTVNR